VLSDNEKWFDACSLSKGVALWMVKSKSEENISFMH